MLLSAILTPLSVRAVDSSHTGAAGFGKTSLVFEPNRGQAEAGIHFVSRGDRYRLFLGPTGATLALKDGATRLRLDFAGASGSALMEGVDPTGGQSNYLLGGNSTTWVRGVPHYSRVRCHSVYRSIDVEFYGSGREFEYDFVLAPGADVRSIELKVTGAKAMRIDAEGNLVLETSGEPLIQRRPVVYQTVAGGRKTIAGRYRLLSRERVGFEIAQYDRRLPLRIDPVLSYATYLGGSGVDAPTAIAVDAGGNVYITGNTQSLDFPVTSNAYQRTLKGGSGDTDVFVTKLSADGKTVLYSTYLGGSGYDSANAIAVDATGIYVAGTTSSANFPTTAGVVQTTYGGYYDAFVTKLAPAGDTLVYSTFFGGSNNDGANALAVDSAGNVFITGSTYSNDFPTSPGAFQTVLRGQDAFVAKLNPTATARLYSTYVGGTASDSANGLALYSSNGSTYAYVTGQTWSADFPATAGAQQLASGGGTDAFVAKLNADGTGLVYATYLGGYGEDAGNGIAVDSAGAAYVTGWTYSQNYPVTPGAYQTSLQAWPGAYLTKVTPAGALSYSTHFGGSDTKGVAVVVDSSGQAVIAGGTYASTIPVRGDAFQTVRGCCGGTAYLTRFNASGSNVLYSTYLGGGVDSTVPSAMAFGPGDSLYVAGTTTAADFPATSGSFQTAGHGQQDGFVAKFDWATTPAASMVASVSALTFDSYVAAGNTTPATQTISVASTGSPIPFTVTAATASGGPWLSVSTNAATTPANITVAVNAAGLTAGFYSGAISFVAPGVSGGHTIVNVSLNVTKPYLNMNPSGLTFSYIPGGATPGCQPVSLSGSNDATVSFTDVSTNASWLSATPKSGSAPGSLTVCVNPVGLPLGVQTGTVYLLAPYAANTPATIPVTLRVGPQVQVNLSSISFQHVAGGCAMPDQTVTVSSTGGALSFSASASSTGWLSVTPASGNTGSTLTVKADATGLAPGSYTGTITIAAPDSVNQSATVSVGLYVAPFTISTAGPITLIAPGGSTPVRSTIPIYGNDNCLAAGFTATASSTGGWLTVAPASGTVPGPPNAANIAAIADPTGKADGTYAGTVTIASPAASNSPITVPVTLKIGPQLQVSNTYASFTYTLGGCALSTQALTVSSTGSPLNFSAVSNAAWLSVTPASGTTLSSIVLRADPAGLPPGFYSATVTLTAPGAVNGAVTVNANLWVNSAVLSATNAVTLIAQAGSSTAVRNDVYISANDACLTHNFTAAASSEGGWLSVTPTSGAAPSSGTYLSIVADPTGKADGTYTGTITLTSATASNSPITIPVTLKVGPILTLSTPPYYLNFTAAPGSAPPPAQALLVGSGATSIPFTVTTSQFGGNWLSAAPASDNTSPGGLKDVSVSVNPAGLAAGSYSGSVTISSPQSLVPAINIPVSFTVGPRLSLSVSNLSFTQAPGGAAPPAQTLTVATGVSAMSYSVQAVSSTGWLSATPAFGTTPGSITVAANAGSLPAGTYAGAITVTAPGAISSPTTINVSLTVAASMTVAPASLSFNGLGPADQAILVTANTPLGNVSASAVSSGWLSVAPGLGTGFTVSVNEAGLTPGFYSGYVVITAAGMANSPQTVPVSINVPQPALSSPANTSVGVSRSPTLAWVAVPGATSYDVYIGNTSPPPFAANVTAASYSPPGLTGSTTYYWRVLAKSGASSSGSPTWSFATAVSAVALRFVPMTPCRVADTRNAAGPFGSPRIAGGATRIFNVPAGACNVPATAQAYSLNLAVVPAGPLGYVTVWPSGQSQPVASTLNSLDGRVKSNAAIVPAGVDGGLSVFASNATDVILDINGYFVPATDPAGLAFYPITPCRIADTRGATAPLAGPSLVGGQTRSFPVLSATACNIPAAAQAYALNFAAVPKGPLGYLTAWPAGQTQPLASTVNAPTGTVTANAAIVPAGAGGAVNVFASNNTDLVIDINGYFAPPATGGLSLYNVTPCRIRDTRQPAGSQPFTGQLDLGVAGGACGMPVAPAYVLGATVVPPGALGYVTLWPQAQVRPLVATLNALDGSVTSNLAIVPAASGSISAFASNASHLVLDMFGYFAP